MNTTLIAIFNPLVIAIGQALVTFVWQGAIIGCITAALLQLLRNAAPQIRYAVSCAALLLCVLLPLVTLLSVSLDPTTTKMMADPIDTFAGAPSSASIFTVVHNWIQIHLTSMVGIWAVCVGLFSARLTLGMIWVARITSSTHSQINAYWQRKVNQLAKHSGLRRTIRVLQVHNLSSPAVAGWLRPVILVPASLIAGMPPELLEALLAHEVAHIRRMDYLVNLLQSAVEILLFYHPAVWWISKQVRIEREKVADDLASHWIGEPRRLALALSELERVQFSQHQLALPANGGNLFARIERLTHPKIQPIGLKAIIPALSLVLASLAFYGNATADASTSAAAKTDAAKATFNLATCKPQYPRQSLSNNEQGTVRLLFAIDKSGQVTSATIEQSSSHPLLDEAALNALKTCEFKPASKDGKPIASTVPIDYVWKLDN